MKKSEMRVTEILARRAGVYEATNEFFFAVVIDDIHYDQQARSHLRRQDCFDRYAFAYRYIRHTNTLHTITNTVSIIAIIVSSPASTVLSVGQRSMETRCMTHLCMYYDPTYLPFVYVLLRQIASYS